MSSSNRWKTLWTNFATAAAVTLAMLLAGPAAAVELIWGGTSSDNWSDANNWAPVAAPGQLDDLKFTDTDSAGDSITVTNIVDGNRKINSLWYSNLDPFVAGVNVHRTQIGAGTTLSIVGGRVPPANTADGPYAIWVGMGPDADAGSSGVTSAIIAGAGAIELKSSIDIVVRNSGSTAGNAHSTSHRMAVLDMSGLGNFTGKFEKMLIGTAGPTLVANTLGAGGTIKLAQNTVLTSHRSSIGNIANPLDGVDVITVGWTPSGLSSGSRGSIELGQSTTFNVSSFTVGKDRSSGAVVYPLPANPSFDNLDPAAGLAFNTVTFQTGLTNATLLLRGKEGGNSRLNYFGIADSSDTTSTQGATNNSLRHASGFVDLTDANGGGSGSINARIDTMYLGRSINSTAAGASMAFGVFNAKAGTMDINTLRIGWQQTNLSAGSTGFQHQANGVMNLGGTMDVTINGHTNLGRDAGNLNRTGTGFLNLSDTAIFRQHGHMFENNATGGNGNSTLTLAGSATLNMKPGSDELGGDIQVDTVTVGAGTTISGARNITTSTFVTDPSSPSPTNTTLIAAHTGTALSGSGTISGLTGALTVEYSNPTPGSFGGTISGSGRFVKTGTGTYALGGSNSFSGTTTISEGTLQLTIGSALGSSSSAIVATGATLDVTPLGTYALPVGQTLTGLGTVSGSVSAAAGRVLSAGVGTLDVGTLTVAGDVGLSGGTVVVDVTAGGTNDTISATNVNVASNSSFYINPTGADVAVGTQNVLSYSGSLTLGGTLSVSGPLAAGESRRTATIGNTGPAGGNVTVTFGGSAPLASTWNGNGTTNRWEANGADNNWNAGGGANSSKYFNLDTATFGAAGGANTSVNVAESVYAGAVSVTGGNYVFTGAGAFTTPSLNVASGASLTLSNSQVNAVTGSITIDGTLTSNQSASYTNPINITGAASGSFVKTGSNRETYTGNNSGYLGTISVQNGTLRVGSATALGADTAGTTVSGTGTLDLNGFDVSNEPISVSGAGASGIGAITQQIEDVTASSRTDVVYYSGAGVTAVDAQGISIATGKIGNLTLTGATTLGSQGSSAWAVSASASNPSNFNGNNNNLTKVGQGYVRLISQGDTELQDIDVQQGTLSFEYVNFSGSTLPTTLGNSGGTLTVRSGATLAHVNAPTGAANTSTTVVTADKNMVFENGSTWLFQSTTAAPTSSGTYNPALTASGTISLTGDVRFNMQAFTGTQHVQVNSNISGSGRLIKDGAGALILNGDNSAWTGDLVGSSGTIRITSPLAINNNVDIDIPTIGTISSGTGNLMFEAGVGATISYGGNITGSGSVRAGGLGDPTGVVILGGNNTFEGSTAVSAGTLLINGTHPRSATVSATAGATLGGVGTIGDSEILARLDIQAGGFLAPGATVNGIGTLTATGGGTIAGTMKIGFSGASIDKVAVGGALDITTGIVDFDAITALAGGARIFASYGSLVGAAFATVTDLPAGFAIDYNYLGGNQIALVGAGAHPGDFDSDGDVDGADFVAWQTNFPTSSGATLSQGDADGDGDVDGADFVVWQTNFPFTPGPGASPVPEPATYILALLGGAFVLRCRRA